jgi:hypothetical protein
MHFFSTETGKTVQIMVIAYILLDFELKNQLQENTEASVETLQGRKSEFSTPINRITV